MRPRFFSLPSAQLANNTWLARGDGSNGPRVAIIGVGMMGREHLRVALLLGRMRIHGVYDEHAESIERAQKAYRQATQRPLEVYTSLEALCSDEAVDAYLIATPNFTHSGIFERVMKTGKPIFLEKPMATSLIDAQRMVTLAKTYPGFVQLGMQYRFKAQYIEAFHAIRVQKALGAVHTVAMSEYRPPFLNKVGEWNKFNNYSGGTLVEKCCHYFDLINLAVDARPVKVYAEGGRAVNFLDFKHQGLNSDIDDHAFVTVTYDNGTLAHFTLNMFCQELYEELVVTGDQGRLVASESSSFRDGVDSSAKIQIEVSGHPAYDGSTVTYPSAIETSGHSGATFFEHAAFLAQLEGDVVDAATPAQGFRSLLVASAAQHALATGQVVFMDEFCAREQVTWPS
ncbi:MAG: Gfo/Idh/MocA family oxidoreductase [Luminiphilus sp.]|nr:Gfo/Idh/MocA family oxidoreductase [Luminiphilus sp.]